MHRLIFMSVTSEVVVDIVLQWVKCTSVRPQILIFIRLIVQQELRRLLGYILLFSSIVEVLFCVRVTLSYDCFFCTIEHTPLGYNIFGVEISKFVRIYLYLSIYWAYLGILKRGYKFLELGSLGGGRYSSNWGFKDTSEVVLSCRSLSFLLQLLKISMHGPARCDGR